MAQTYRTLRVAGHDEGVLSVVIDAPPMNLIGPELVRGRTPYWGSRRSVSVRPRARVVCNTWGGCWGGAGPWR